MNADGSHDIQKQLSLSGEPLIDDLQGFYTLKSPMSLLEYQARALQLRNYRQEYSDYWNSTGDKDGNTVDAVLMPAAPHAAVVPGKWVHLGMCSPFLNCTEMILIRTSIHGSAQSS